MHVFSQITTFTWREPIFCFTTKGRVNSNAHDFQQSFFFYVVANIFVHVHVRGLSKSSWAIAL